MDGLYSQIGHFFIRKTLEDVADRRALMEVWPRFRALSTRDWLLIGEAAVLLFLVSVGASVLRFRTLRYLIHRYGLNRCGGSRGSSTDGLSSEQVRRIAWAVVAVARRLPTRTTCLMEALAAEAMLHRRGCACELRFGVRAPGSGSSPLAAHAWIEHQGVVVLGQLENLSDYAVLSPRRSS